MNEDRLCLNCGGEIEVPTDLQLCQDCMDNFYIATLWELHDNSKIDALDFNSNEKLRKLFKKGDHDNIVNAILEQL